MLLDLMFFSELKQWLLKLYNEAISSKELLETILEGIITCILKAGKQPKDLFWFTLQITQFFQFSWISYDHVAKVLLVHNC